MSKKDSLYIDIAQRVGLESHAVRAKVGAVLVRDDNILAYGYNGTPRGWDNDCEDVIETTNAEGEWYVKETKTKREVLHAESNAIAKIARSTQSADGADLFVSLSPCFECAKLIVQSGIKRVVFKEKYRDDSPINFLKMNGIEVEQI